MRISRRLFGLGAGALAIGAGALGYRQWFGGWYLPTSYDDLLGQISDRKFAAALGASLPKTDVGMLAAKLRQPGFGLKERARGDGAAGRVTEAGGWLVPESVALYAQLAAQFA